MSKTITDKQLKQAKQMHDSGIAWLLIANHLKTNATTLRQQLKHYEESNQPVH